MHCLPCPAGKRFPLLQCLWRTSTRPGSPIARPHSGDRCNVVHASQRPTDTPALRTMPHSVLPRLPDPYTGGSPLRRLCRHSTTAHFGALDASVPAPWHRRDRDCDRVGTHVRPYAVAIYSACSRRATVVDWADSVTHVCQQLNWVGLPLRDASRQARGGDSSSSLIPSAAPRRQFTYCHRRKRPRRTRPRGA